MEKTECLIRFDDRSYTLSVETLHHRFFRGSENRFHAHASYHYVLVSQGSCLVHIRGRQPAEAPLNSLVFINPLIVASAGSAAVVVVTMGSTGGGLSAPA